MKMTPELVKVQNKMRPGVITAEGFLGTDTRSLTDIIQKDEETAASIGLDWERAAEAIEFLFCEGKKGFGVEVAVRDELSVTVIEARGFLPCPFGDGLKRKHVAVIGLTGLEKKLLVSELSLHLLKEHHFLQGKGSAFRCEPHFIKKITDMIEIAGSDRASSDERVK
ncbi:MAG: hypothetical protein JW881_15055 [Spirochaetales bacterium]|nr:hypothetical protein [Spirochaetales bacterium]